ncbi:MAG: HesA/MoeB/ThiF family protein [Planctomycetaceae bacterium]|nr:HesA/MoeB/ThiF family protein [Planctomycetaceae bacterium]
MTNTSRYQRQTLFEPFGESGQKKLAEGRVLICGCGALGGNVAQILVRAGVGFLKLIDFDTVSLDNLHRQFLFSEADAAAGAFKTEAARRTLLSGNSSVSIETVIGRLSSENMDELVADADVLIDGTDNFPTRFLLNEAAVRHKLPFVSGGVCGASGQVMTVLPHVTPCLACLLGEQNKHFSLPIDQTNDQVNDRANMFPVLSPVVQVVSAFEAMEVLKILSGNPDAVSRELVSFDLWENRIKKIPLVGLLSEKCPVCS